MLFSFIFFFSLLPRRQDKPFTSALVINLYSQTRGGWKNSSHRKCRTHKKGKILAHGKNNFIKLTSLIDLSEEDISNCMGKKKILFLRITWNYLEKRPNLAKLDWLEKGGPGLKEDKSRCCQERMKGLKLHAIRSASVSQWGWDDEKNDERQGWKAEMR